MGGILFNTEYAGFLDLRQGTTQNSMHLYRRIGIGAGAIEKAPRSVKTSALPLGLHTRPAR